MVPSESIELTSELIILSLVLGTFTLYLRVGFTKKGFWMNCNRCPYTVPNTKGSWVILIHLFANSLSLPPTEIELLLSHSQPQEMSLWLEKLPMLILVGHFCVEDVVLGGFSFPPPDLFLQDHSLSAVMMVLEKSLIPYPAPLCIGVMVLDILFQILPSYDG